MGGAISGTLPGITPLLVSPRVIAGGNSCYPGDASRGAPLPGGTSLEVHLAQRLPSPRAVPRDWLERSCQLVLAVLSCLVSPCLASSCLGLLFAFVLPLLASILFQEVRNKGSHRGPTFFLIFLVPFSVSLASQVMARQGFQVPTILNLRDFQYVEILGLLKSFCQVLNAQSS